VTKLLASTGALVSTTSVGTSPISVAFDGTNIWVACVNGSNVYKIQASTATTVGVYTNGINGPVALAFDGTNIWAANYGNITVSKVLASTGALVATYSVGTNPQGIAFDGSNIWVTNYGAGADTVSKLPAF
jgi:hypothetical protein